MVDWNPFASRAAQAEFPSKTIHNLQELESGFDVMLDAEGSDDDIKLGRVRSVVGVTQSYAVFVEDSGWIRYVTVKDYTEPTGFNLQYNRLTELQFILTQLRDSMQEPQHRLLVDMLGKALFTGLEQDTAAMKEGLDRLETLLKTKTTQNAKRVYVASAARLSSALVLLGVVLLLYPVAVERAQPHDETLLRWAYAIALGTIGGSLGALLSILVGTRKTVPFDPISSAAYATFEARARIMMGLFSGLLMAVAYMAGLIGDELLKDVHPWTAGALLLTTAAGFAERLVPDILMESVNSRVPKPKEPASGEDASQQ